MLCLYSTGISLRIFLLSMNSVLYLNLVAQPLDDLIMKSGWTQQTAGAPPTKRKSARPAFCIHDDITNGREKFEIPVYNEVDNSPAPLEFTYVNRHVSGGANLVPNPSFLSCCTCTDNCRDPTRCECAQLNSGPIYDDDGLLIASRGGTCVQAIDR